MKTSESIGKIAPALGRAQKKIGAAVKGSNNPFFRSKYADLGAVMEACKEQLNDEGITVLQPVLSDETGDYVETVLLHESGEYISSKMRLLPSKNMQELGSATSYARRYGLQSLVFIPSEDDDGNHSTFGKAAPEPKKEAPKSAPAVQEASKAAVESTPAPKRSSFKKSAPVAQEAPKVEAKASTTTNSDDGWE